MAGGSVVPPDLAVPPYRTEVHARCYNGGPSKSFTPIERRVLSLLRSGEPNKVIAGKLSLPESSIKNHVRALMKKTGTRNRVELAISNLPVDVLDS
jgi:DNA-binding NarL/FixJ family response regulator